MHPKIHQKLKTYPKTTFRKNAKVKTKASKENYHINQIYCIIIRKRVKVVVQTLHTHCQSMNCNIPTTQTFFFSRFSSSKHLKSHKLNKKKNTIFLSQNKSLIIDEQKTCSYKYDAKL